MRWAVAATFFDERAPDTLRWLDDSAPRPGRSFEKVGRDGPEASWHGRRMRATPLQGWTAQLRQALRCVRADGIVTVFPPLAMAVGMLQRIGGTSKPHVAWCFNMGSHPGGLRRRLARAAARKVTRFVVHSRAEVAVVADYLAVPRDRVRFVPLQTTAFLSEEEEEEDYVVAMGSANRDYATFLEAMRIAGLPGKLVASPRVLRSLPVPTNVEVMGNVSAAASRRLAAAARLCVVPLDLATVAAGQVTLVDAAAMGRCVVATRSIGTVDYLEDDANGVLVPPHDAEALARAMLDLWNDDARRRRLGAAARDLARRDWSDAATGAVLNAMLTEAEAERGN